MKPCYKKGTSDKSSYCLVGAGRCCASGLLVPLALAPDQLCHRPPPLTMLPQKQALLGLSSLGVLQSHEFSGLLPKQPDRMSHLLLLLIFHCLVCSNTTQTMLLLCSKRFVALHGLEAVVPSYRQCSKSYVVIHVQSLCPASSTEYFTSL